MQWEQRKGKKKITLHSERRLHRRGDIDLRFKGYTGVFSEAGSEEHSTLRTCKTQNSGLRSMEEKPRDPINQPSRCNTQEGLLPVVQTGDSDLLGGRAHRTANWASFL